MTWKYDISQIGRSWCLNDRLDLSENFAVRLKMHNPKWGGGKMTPMLLLKCTERQMEVRTDRYHVM